MKKYPLFLIFACLSATIFFTCTKKKPTEMVGSSETENVAIKGTLVDVLGNPVEGAVVKLSKTNNDPRQSTTPDGIDTTDANGQYEIAPTDTGEFNIEAVKDTIGVLIDSVDVGSTTEDTNVPVDTMKRLSVITGISHMPGLSDTDQVRLDIYMPGTIRFANPILGGKFSFGLVPEGNYTIYFVPFFPEYKVKILDTAVTAGDTLDLDTVRIPKVDPDTVDITQTAVSGVWGPSKIYRLFGNVEICAGCSLRILPETQIILMGDFEIVNNGSFIVKGESGKLVSFRPSFSGTWKGIKNLKSGDSIAFAIFDSLSHGVEINDSNVTINNIVIRNSTNCLRGGGLTSDYTIFLRNCVFQNSDALIGSYYMANYRIVNSIFVNLNTIVFQDLRDFSVTVTHSCLFNTPLTYQNISGTFSVSDPTNITGDPLFQSLDKGKEDYHLQPSSPCIGTGYNGTDMGIFSTFDPGTVPFIPQNLNLAYDTLKQIVTLTWSPLLFQNVKGYNVYRKHSDSGFVKANGAVVSDTIFLDSSGSQDETYEYKITAVDPGDNEGDKSPGDSLRIVSAYILTDTIIQISGALGNFVVDTNDNFFVINHTSNEIAVFDKSGLAKRTWAIPGGLMPSYQHADKIAIDDSGFIYLANRNTNVTQKFDSLGNMVDTYSFSKGYRVMGLSLIGDTLFFVDGDNAILYAGNKNGDSLFALNHNWDGLAGDMVYSLTTDKREKIYVTGFFGPSISQRQNTVEVFSSDGQFLKAFPFKRGGGAITISNNKILITSLRNIYCYDLEGNLLFKFAVPATTTTPSPVKAFFTDEGKIIAGFLEGYIAIYSLR